MGKQKKKSDNKKSKNKVIIFGIIITIAIIVIYSIFWDSNSKLTPEIPLNAGILGTEHVHQGIAVMIHGELIDFSISEFQERDELIQFEDQDRFTIHRHATDVPIGYFLETLGFRLDEDCISVVDKDFCSDENNSWRFFINNESVKDIQNYVGDEGDIILITYGNLVPQEISAQLYMVDNMKINTTP